MRYGYIFIDSDNLEVVDNVVCNDVLKTVDTSSKWDIENNGTRDVYSINRITEPMEYRSVERYFIIVWLSKVA